MPRFTRARRQLRAFVIAMAAAVAAPMLAAAPASAQILGLVDDTGVNPQDLARLLQQWGYRAEVKTDQQGEPEIVSAVEGLTFVIFFYDCNKSAKGKCLSYQFWAGFRDLNPPVTLEKLNDWNEKQRWTMCSTDGQGRVRVKMSVNPRGTDLEQNFKNWFNWWQRSLADFKKHINFRG
ncbi:YbjN domain-containing protein [Vineibacter terrae]|nr:YbjN domain-containing protein [Vineibacter terrae]